MLNALIYDTNILFTYFNGCIVIKKSFFINVTEICYTLNCIRLYQFHWLYFECYIMILKKSYLFPNKNKNLF